LPKSSGALEYDQMQSFNDGLPYHGSSDMQGGKLKGATGETDYFYFFCPKCPDDYAMRILEYRIHTPQHENEYNESTKSKAKYGFTLAFNLHCEKCGHDDFVKISNTAWQGGTHREMLAKVGASQEIEVI
jgi:hypothetical protein